jgi:26S proteasome regulatory subunit N1
MAPAEEKKEGRGDSAEEEKSAEAIPVEAPTKEGKKKDEKKEELTEEDVILKEGLELAVVRLQEDEGTGLHGQALNHLVTEIKSATSSMTSVPKPLKFLRPHYDALKVVYESWSVSNPMKRQMADVMSVLAMTMAPPNSRECLKFKLAGTQVNISSWGHEYVRSLAGEISEEFNQRTLDSGADEDADVEDLMALVDDIVPFQMSHNAEAEAVDLLIEVRQLNKLMESPVVDERNHARVCLYLLRSADFMVDPDDLETLYDVAYNLYKNQKKYTDALRVAIKVDNSDLIDELFSDEVDAPALEKKQMALLLGRHRSRHVLQDDDLDQLVGNCSLSERFLGLAKEMDAIAPKVPEDIYKTAAAAGNKIGRSNTAAVDSAKANLASTFVNAFVNSAYCKDKLIIEAENTNWLFKNKDSGKMSAAASLGMLMMWNVDEGLNQIDKFFHNKDDHIRAGACLGVGIVTSGVRNEAEPAMALLCDYITDEGCSSTVRTASVCGLGLAYAGTQNEDVKELLVPPCCNTGDITESSMAALSLGLVYVGSCNEDVATDILSRLMEATNEELDNTASRFLSLGLGLLFLGKGDKVDAILEAVKTIEHKRGRHAEATLETCAYTGTGNVLKVQQMLRMCTEHLQEDAEHQAVAVLGIALITVGEEIGTEMTLRSFEHLLHYGELPVRRVVPLALALLYVSNPEYSIIDQLSRLSHDQDPEIAQSAIFGLGLVCAGTNNARVAGLLRQLSEFYAKEANHLFVVRIAQGLNAMGKGLIGLSFFHSDRLLLSSSGLAGILVVLHAMMDIKGTILDKFHYILFYLCISMNSRCLAAVDEDLNPVTASVRVGQAVETVGQAGRPKTISGFQTHTTPVLLGHKDRAELAGVEYVSVSSSVMEGFVIVQKTPEQMDTEQAK